MTPSPRATGRVAQSASLALLVALAATLPPGCAREPDATTCATGIYCPAGSRCAARQAVCLVNGCGDGVLEAGEVCDDGDVVDGNGCSANCKSAEVCGNGIVDTAVGEVCEAPDRCSDDCRSTLACGNGKFDPGEDCDPGALPTAICNVDCSVSRHGDGIVNPLDLVQDTSHGELCDGGVPGGNSPSCQSTAGCTAGCCTNECTPSAHGDGIVNPAHLVPGTNHGELCDGGVKDQIPPSPSCESESCDVDCTPARCGDATHNALHTAEGTSHLEACDDGNTSPNDDCLPSCALTFCGDGVRNTAGSPEKREECDGGAALNSDAADCPYGLQSCPGCSTACRDTAPTPHFCGDLQIDVARPDAGGVLRTEQCDSAFSFACGKCSTETCQYGADAKATGTVTIPSGGGSDLRDGDSLTFDDGLGGVVTVRFTRVTEGTPGTSCSAGPPAVCVIEFKDSTGRNALASSLATVTAHTLWTAKIAVPSAPETNVVTFRNDGAAGVAGNVPIVKSPSTSKLVVSDMSGGAGCPVGFRCSSDADCVGGIAGSCAGNECITPPPPPQPPAP